MNIPVSTSINEINRRFSLLTKKKSPQKEKRHLILGFIYTQTCNLSGNMNQKSPKASEWCCVGVTTPPQPQTQVALKKMNGDKGKGGGDDGCCCSKNGDYESGGFGSLRV